MKKMTRILALILALALCFTCMAVSVFAASGDGDDTTGGEQKPGDTTGGEQKPGDTTGGDSKPSVTPAPAPVSEPVVEHATKFVPDVSGHFRTSAAKIVEKVKPAEVARQNLYVDPVTNTIVNLYDADGNLIPATLSTDGHFYIVPTNDGYVYIPVA